MANQFPIADSQLLDSLFLSTSNTLTTDPAWLINDGGQKTLRKAAERGRVFKEINDADAVEHLLITGTTPDDAWKHYKGSREAAGNQAMGSATALAVSQNGLWQTARSTILDTASNFVIPEDLVKRPVQNQIDTMAGLLKRHMNEFYREQEAYFMLGAAAVGADPVATAPHSTDTDFGAGTDYSIPSFSLLGLFTSGLNNNRDGVTTSQYGDLSGEKYMGIQTDGDDDSEWAPYIDAVDNDDTDSAGTVKTAIAAGGQTIYEYLQKYIIRQSRYGPGEMVTDWMVSPEMYEELLKYLRGKTNLNDSILANLATTTELPISGTMLDFHHWIDGTDEEWDITSETTPVATHPIIGINWNSLRFNMVYGEASEGSWLTPISDFQVAETSTWMYKRLHSRSCWSLDNGRRSFVYSDRFKN
jgi:hypothetical protein